MPKHLVLAGGGHAHMLLLANISRIKEAGHRVTVVQPSEHHYYSGMGPGMLSGYYKPDDIRFKTQHVVEKQGGTFLLDKVDSIDASNNMLSLESGGKLEYDILSCNTGSYIPADFLGQTSETVFSAKPIERLLEAKETIIGLAKIQKKISMAIIGGGPAAIEIGGCVHQLSLKSGFKDIEITLFSGPNLMKEFPRAVQHQVRRSLIRRDIAIVEKYVKHLTSHELVLDDGNRGIFDLAFVATGVKPNPIFQKSGLPTGPDGGLCVNAQLQCVTHTNILGGGDCIHFQPHPLNKVGVYAVRQNPILLHNIWSLLEGGPPQEFHPGGGYLLIFNMGDRTGILHKAGWTLHGKSAFYIKNYIDKRFIKKFQSLE